MYICSAKKHYDLLIDENNDPVYDPPELKRYMDGWDGDDLINALSDYNEKSVLEIGVGTGRLAVRVCGLCKKFTGIDFSPKTIRRAAENLAAFSNINLICADFTRYRFRETFDAIYASLVFFHIKNKRAAIEKIFSLLNRGGVFALSVDKNADRFLSCGTRKIRLYPDDAQKMKSALLDAGFSIEKIVPTEKAFLYLKKK